MIEQPGLFPEPEPARVPRPAGVQPDDPSDRPVYSNYRPKTRVHCDDCVQEIHDRTPERAPYPASARFRRRQGTEVRALCAAHRQARERTER